MENVTEHEAFLAMYEFLRDRYERTKSDDLGALLGGLSLLADRVTADPTAWQDWVRAVEKAKRGLVDARLILKEK